MGVMYKLVIMMEVPHKYGIVMADGGIFKAKMHSK